MSVSGASPQAGVSRWPRYAAAVAIAAVAVSLATMAYLHVAAVPRVSPVADTVSSYVHTAGGGSLLAVGALSLALGFAALVSGLAAAGVRFDATTRALAAVWGLSLVAIVLFPANLPGAPPTVSGILHNWAGGSVFVTLPLAAWRMSAALTARIARTVRRLAMGAGVALVGFVVTHPPLHRWYGGAPMHGLGERVLLALQIGLLLVLATHLLRRTP